MRGDDDAGSSARARAAAARAVAPANTRPTKTTTAPAAKTRFALLCARMVRSISSVLSMLARSRSSAVISSRARVVAFATIISRTARLWPSSLAAFILASSRFLKAKIFCVTATGGEGVGVRGQPSVHERNRPARAAAAAARTRALAHVFVHQRVHLLPFQVLALDRREDLPVRVEELADLEEAALLLEVALEVEQLDVVHVHAPLLEVAVRLFERVLRLDGQHVGRQRARHVGVARALEGPASRSRRISALSGGTCCGANATS